MPISIYTDANVPRAVARGLRERGVDVLRCEDDGHRTVSDGDILNRTIALGRVLFSHDIDFIKEAASMQAAGRSFPGVIYAHQSRLSTKECLEQLELIAKAGTPSDFRDKVQFLPI